MRCAPLGGFVGACARACVPATMRDLGHIGYGCVRMYVQNYAAEKSSLVGIGFGHEGLCFILVCCFLRLGRHPKGMYEITRPRKEV